MKVKTKFTLNEVLDTLKEKKLNRDEYSLLYSSYETQIGKDGYLQFKLTEKDNWKNVHTLVNQYFNSEEHDKKHIELIETKIEKCLVTHHVNFFEKENKINNHPDNLLWLGLDEHRILHEKIMCEVVDKMWNPENTEYCNFEVQREKIKLAASENGRKHFEILWHGENNEEFRAKILPILIENGKKIMNENWHGENSEVFREKMKLIKSENNYELWHGENSEVFRTKILPTQIENGKKIMNERWHGENNEEYRKKMKLIRSENNYELWHGENNKEFRTKMKPFQIESGKKVMKELWHGENNEEFREKMLTVAINNISEHNDTFWNGEDNKLRRKEQSERIKGISENFWYGENNEENRKNHAERLSKRNADPEHKRKVIEGKIFKIFKKILEAGEEISNETFIKYKFNGAPYPITVFGYGA